jgi:large subunit ribosomal protein L24
MKKRSSQTQQASFHVKKGDEVVVLTGAQRGKRGKILQIITKKNRVLIEGVNLIKKAMRKSQDNPQGVILEREASLHISKVMLAQNFDARKKSTDTQKKSK